MVDIELFLWNTQSRIEIRVYVKTPWLVYVKGYLQVKSGEIHTGVSCTGDAQTSLMTLTIPCTQEPGIKFIYLSSVIRYAHVPVSDVSLIAYPSNFQKNEFLSDH